MSWINSDWMKEWIRLALQDEVNRKREGFWYYDNSEFTYKYIKFPP